MNILLLIVVAVLAILTLIAMRGTNATPEAYVKPKRNRGFRRTWRKLYLLPIGIKRLTGWLPGMGRRGSRPYQVQFANIGEATHDHGVKSYIPDGGTTSRYLLYKRGSDADHCAICGAGDDPLGTSDDQADANNLDVPIAIKLAGAFEGTARVITDGTISNGDYMKCGAVGQATKANNGDLCFGRAVIGTDSTKAAGDAIGYIGTLPCKLTF